MKRWLSGVVGVLALLALGGCDPYVAAAPGTAALDVSVHMDGRVTALLFLDETHRDASELRTAGEEVAARLFPGRPGAGVQVDGNGGGYPFAALEAQGVYRPGARPQVPLDTRDAVAWLLAHGARSVDVGVDAPTVPLTASWSPQPPPDEARAYWRWEAVTSAAGAPTGVLRMAPRPWVGVVPPAALAAAVALLVASVVVARRRRRLPAVLLAVASFAGPAVPMWVVLPVELDSLGVAGWLPEAGVTAVSIVTALSFLVLPVASVAAVTHALVVTRRRTAAPA